MPIQRLAALANPPLLLRDGAVMVLETLSVAKVAMRRVAAAVQKDEAGRAFAEGHPNHDQGVKPHFGSGGWRVIRKQAERIDSVQAVAVDAYRPVRVAAEVLGQGCPGVADASHQAVQRVPHVSADAVHVDVQLVLAASCLLR